MIDRRKPKMPPPPDGVERRKQMRRETDAENQEIVEHAVEDAPIVNRILHTSKVAAAIALIFTLVGGAGGAIGMSIRGPSQDIADVRSAVNLRLDSNTARDVRVRIELDSLVMELREMRQDARTTKNLACISARARNAEVARAAGCEDR